MFNTCLGCDHLYSITVPYHRSLISRCFVKLGKGLGTKLRTDTQYAFACSAAKYVIYNGIILENYVILNYIIVHYVTH